MDGTTAGPLPAPQPTSAGGNLFIERTLPVAPQLAPAQAVQPQFSQLTPIYAPGPTNTVADIPQPEVKGIEFVQVPTPIASPQAPTVQSVPQPMPAVSPMPITPPVPVASQLIQPILPPPQPPAQPAMQAAPIVAEQRVPTPEESLPANDYAIQKIENVDLGQMVGAVSQPGADNAPSQTVDPKDDPTKALSNYFQPKPQEDIIIVNNRRGFSLSNINFRVVRLVGIILLAIGLLVGGYFVVSGIINSQQAQKAPSVTTPQTPAVTQPDFTNTQSSSVPAVTPVTPSVPTVTTPETTTTPAPAPTPVQPATTVTPSSPVVSNSGLQW